MKYEPWFVGSHRTVDRLIDGRRVAICEVYSGAADNLDQADEFQRLIAAAPALLSELQRLVATMLKELASDPERARINTMAAQAVIEKITGQEIKI